MDELKITAPPGIARNVLLLFYAFTNGEAPRGDALP
jgi:hypothetical protein